MPGVMAQGSQEEMGQQGNPTGEEQASQRSKVRWAVILMQRYVAIKAGGQGLASP